MYRIQCNFNYGVTKNFLNSLWNEKTIRIDVLSTMKRPILTNGIKSTYHLVCDSFLRGWLLLNIKHFLCENNVHTFVLTLFGEHLSMELTFKSSYFLQITIYSKHVISDIPLSVGFHYIPCKSSHSGNDVIIVLRHLTCLSKFEEVLSIYESQGS